MRGRPSLVAVFIAAIFLLLPLASAEFGPESEDGFPMNIHGEVLYPPVYPVVLLEPPGSADPLNKVGPFTVYPYYPLLTLEVQRLAEEYPHLVRLTSAGKSYAGLDLWLLEIADFENPDMKPLSEREVVYLDGGTHSNEYSGVYFVTEIAQFLAQEYETNETARWIVENRHTWILPMVNPDGSNAFGRINAMGININRNFPFTWGAVDELPGVNDPGPHPASEPETKIVMEVMQRVQPDYVNSIHCCGNLWLHPYGAEHLGHAPDVEMYTRICDEIFMDVRDRCGPIWSTIYPASGTTADEGYGLVGASSWTYEMSGRGRIAGPWAEPVTREDVRYQERESWSGVMHAFLHVHQYGARPEIVSIGGTASALEVVVENVGYGAVTFANLTLGSETQTVPTLASGERATLTFSGSYAESVAVGLDWEKRVWLGPQGLQAFSVPLVEQDGRLVGVLGTSDAVTPAAADVPSTSVPGPAVALVLGALVLAGAAMRRRS